MPEQQQETDQLEEMREQLASLPAGDLVAEASLSLVALAYVRLGLPPEQHERYRDLDAARLLIDALGGMLQAVQGRVGAAEPGLREALASLRMAYAEVAAHLEAGHQEAPAGAPAGAAATPPSGPAQPPPSEGPGGPGIYRPSGLWVPGRE
jgi:Domain of unknown function (DUF1844)